MSVDFNGFFLACQERCNQALPVMLAGPATAERHIPEQLLAAGNYSLSNGGKRIRPVLVYAAAQALNAPRELPGLDHAACAIEMLHTYSLIHDDLPAMDDDDLRRGIPSCHKAFDEATAILVGDGLQARAFELITEAPALEPVQKLEMIRTLAAAAGPAGMVGGQAIDITAVGTDMELAQLRAMHNLKTGALIRAALAMGGISAGGTDEQLQALDDYGRHIGLAFQVVDDILDVEGQTAVLGKTSGKDSEANKPTYVKLLGLRGAREEAERLLACAIAAVESLGEAGEHLRGLARYIVQRES